MSKLNPKIWYRVDCVNNLVYAFWKHKRNMGGFVFLENMWITCKHVNMRYETCVPKPLNIRFFAYCLYNETVNMQALKKKTICRVAKHPCFFPSYLRLKQGWPCQSSRDEVIEPIWKKEATSGWPRWFQGWRSHGPPTQTASLPSRTARLDVSRHLSCI